MSKKKKYIILYYSIMAKDHAFIYFRSHYSIILLTDKLKYLRQEYFTNNYII